MTRLIAVVALTFLLSGNVLAHGGHGHSDPGQGISLWHYVTEPQHAWAFFAVFLFGVGVLPFYFKAGERLLCRLRHGDRF